jgi:pimeloyl-ACP methyl ester carboxylesterase
MARAVHSTERSHVDVGAYGSGPNARWRSVDWRQHQRWVMVHGTPVNTIELGSGPPLVFVHGLAGSWPNWLEQLAQLSDDFRVVAMDLPGFGHSPLPAQEITIASYARLLDALLTELGLGAATVVGNSMGGFISAELAIAFPERVERLVVVSPAGISTYDDPATRRAMPAMVRLERISAMAGAWVAAHSDSATSRPRLREALMWVVARHPDRLDHALAAEQVRGAGKPGFLAALQAVVDYELGERLPEIACPTLIVWGEDDRLISSRDAAVFGELIPNSRVAMFPDTGHMTMLERPQAFNAMLREFATS